MTAVRRTTANCHGGDAAPTMQAMFRNRGVVLWVSTIEVLTQHQTRRRLATTCPTMPRTAQTGLSIVSPMDSVRRISLVGNRDAPKYRPRWFYRPLRAPASTPVAVLLPVAQW